MNKIIKKIVDVLSNDVSWRFKERDKQELPLYSYDYKARSHDVIFDKESVDLIITEDVIPSRLEKWLNVILRK